MLKRLLHASDQMHCARVSELIPLHVAGDLSAGRAQVLARHLQSCANCRAKVDEYAASRAWLQAGAQPVFTDEFYADIRAAVLRQIKQERTPAAPQSAPFFAALFSWRTLSVAASVALLCMAGALVWQAYATHQPQQTATTDTHSEQVSAPAPNVPAAPNSTSAMPPIPQRAVRDNDQPVRDQFVAYAPRPHFVRHIRPAKRTVMPLPKQQELATTSMEVARIELQTADPNIRIIWLAQQPAAASFTKDR